MIINTDTGYVNAACVESFQVLQMDGKIYLTLSMISGDYWELTPTEKEYKKIYNGLMALWDDKELEK